MIAGRCSSWAKLTCLTAGVANNEKGRAEALAIVEIRGSGHTFEGSHIASKRRVIVRYNNIVKKADKYLADQNAEIQALENELRLRPEPPALRLSRAGRDTK